MTARSLLTTARFDLDHDGAGIRGARLRDLADLGLPEAVRLDAVRRLLSAEIDAEAERQRLAYITPGVGQAMEYQEAQAQAQAALKAPTSASSAKYPMLAASIGIDIDPSTGAKATDVLGVARCVDAARTDWLNVGIFIRSTRLAAKAALAEAGTQSQLEAAFDAVSWVPPPASA